MRPPIGQPSIYFMSLLVTENTHSLVNFNGNFLNIVFLQKCLISLRTQILCRIQSIVYWTGILVNKLSML